MWSWGDGERDKGENKEHDMVHNNHDKEQHKKKTKVDNEEHNTA